MEPHKSAPGRWPALLVCLAAGFMTLLDVSIFNVALPSIDRALPMSPTELSWAVAGYASAFGLALIPAGRLGDKYGRRGLFLAGLALFTAAGVLCGSAPNASVLVVARICRGVAAGVLAPQVIGLLQLMYTGPTRGRAFGYYGATVGLSTAVGPLLGGVIIQAFGATDGWRFVFYISVPVTLLALAIGFRALPRDPRGRAHRRPARSGRPLARVRGYPLGVTIAAVFFAGFTGIFLVVTMFLQQGLRYSALQAAEATLVFTFASTGSAVVGGRLVHRLGRRIVVHGSAIATLGLTALAAVAYRWTGPHTALALAVPLLAAGCGCGLVISANQTLTLREVPRAHTGTAAGIYEAAQRIGTALGAALANTLYFDTLTTAGGDFHAAAGLGLAGPAALVGLAWVIGLAERG